MRRSSPLWLLWGVLLLRAMPLAAHEAQTYFETGVRAFTEGQYDEAVTALTQAITSYPHYAQAYYMLGNTYYQQQNYAQARQTFERAVTSYPGYAEAHYMLGATLYQQKEFGAAEQAVRWGLGVRRRVTDVRCLGIVP